MIKFALMENNFKDYSPEINYNDNETIEDKPIVSKPPHPKDNNVKKRSASRKRKMPPAATAAVNKNIFTEIKRLATGQSIRLITGIFLGCVGVYLLVSFISYISTCIQDQSLINSVPVGSAGKVHNSGGEGGARLSEFLINEGFGAGAFVIVFWLFAMSMKLLTGAPRFKSVNFTIKCLVALITVSLIVGMSTVWTHSQVNWGGYHARYVYKFIDEFTGTTGSALICIFMVALFVVICMHDLISWLKRVYERRKQQREEQRKIREEEMRLEMEKEHDIRQDQIDDIASGETNDKGESNNLYGEENDNGGVSFTDDDSFEDAETALYSLDTVKNNADGEDEESEEGLDENREEHIEEIDKAENIEKPEESVISTEITTEDKNTESKMIVNVNQIGEGDNKQKSTHDPHSHYKYKFPPYDILRPGVTKISVDANEQLENKERIKQTLLDFGIPITDIRATVGPTVTLYEIVPDKGVKIAKIRNLVDDIALSLSATGVRIIAPIPGKGTVGIEVANKDPLVVSMQTIIKSKKYQESKYILPIALGSTISNDVYIADLAKMPHLLVAGATGQGKSVGLNAMIASLLYCKSPVDLKFVMIDPKQVEFSLYNKLKDHYMAVIPEEMDSTEPVITDMKKVEATVNSLCIEMDNRYTLFKNANVRTIEEYNQKIKEGILNPQLGHKFLPYIVVVVDEFGDLIMVLGKNVELPIARLAQKARAVGMHVIIATQRPSTNVITGVLKANFPARISFKVSSGVDSKTILDATGAQHLIGDGDMLIFNKSEMIRVQCALIETAEVEEICDYVARQPYPTGAYELPEPQISTAEDGNNSMVHSPLERDPYFEEVAQRVVAAGKASTSAIQRSYPIGYNRAGKIMDQLEALGIVGPSQGGKARSVLVDLAELEAILNSLK